MAEQERTLADPDRVRPDGCPTCHRGAMHVHERRERVLAGELEGPPTVGILIFRCARRDECGAVWRMLPSFVARHLWRTWTLVGVVLTTDGPGRHRVPSRTQQRWRARLRRSGAVLVVLLGQSGVAEQVEAARALGDAATREGVVVALGGATRLARIAERFERLEPGVRVM